MMNSRPGEAGDISAGAISTKWIHLIHLKLLLLNNKRGIAFISLVLIILTLLAITIVIVSQFISKWMEAKKHHGIYHPAQNSRPILAICTRNDLNFINPEVTKSLRVNDPILEISPPDSNNVNASFQSIKELVVSNQMSEAWLFYFISAFPALEIATLDVYQLCLGSKEESPETPLLLKPLIAQNLKTLQLVNFNHCDSIPVWIFRWGFPQLEKLIIRNGTISQLSFTALEELLPKLNKILNIEFKDCTFCIYCNRTSLNTSKSIVNVSP